MKILKKIIRKLDNSFGIDIVKLEKPSGLIAAVDEIFEQYYFDKVFYYRHSLVVKL